MNKPLAVAAVAMTFAAAAPSHAAGQPAPGAGLRPGPLEVAHAQALDSFRRARFSEAYGRFIKLAEAGHAASARYAIWMCENGQALFGVPWDCAPQELEDWRAAAAGPGRTGAALAPGRGR
jgi:hypothetical protein